MAGAFRILPSSELVAPDGSANWGVVRYPPSIIELQSSTGVAEEYTSLNLGVGREYRPPSLSVNINGTGENDLTLV